MDKTELIEVLRRCAADDDTELAHMDADAALIEFINDPEIKDAYNAFEKWYA